MSDSLADGGGDPTEMQIRLYERWAQGGIALSIIGEFEGEDDAEVDLPENTDGHVVHHSEWLRITVKNSVRAKLTLGDLAPGDFFVFSGEDDDDPWVHLVLAPEAGHDPLCARVTNVQTGGVYSYDGALTVARCRVHLGVEVLR